MAIKIIITGGGTGGHIYPGLNLAFELKNRDSRNDILFIGKKGGMEAELVPREGFKFESISARGIQRKFCVENIWAIVIFFISCIQAYKILKKYKPDVVIGTGGYVSGSVVLMASLMGIATFIHEQNVFPGITNRILSYHVKAIFLSFEQSRKYFKGKAELIFTGNPIRFKEGPLNRKNKKDFQQFRLDPEKKTILVLGGSKGAASINQAVVESIKILKKDLKEYQWQVLLVAGNENYEHCKKIAKEMEKEGMLVVEKYIYHMKRAYSLANLVICRAGATTVAELNAFGLPAILIPYPWATNNHQEYNARVLEKEGAAIVLLDKDLVRNKLTEELLGLIKEEKKLEIMSINSKKLGKLDAAQKIVDFILKYINKNKPIRD